MLKAYLILPFVFAIFFCIFGFIKNPIYVRRIAKVFYFIYFILGCAVFFFCEGIRFSFLNASFEMDKGVQYFIFLVNFIFFLFSIISKNFISKLHKVFYTTSFLLLGLINLLILSDNLCVSLIILFWIFLVNYFLSYTFSNNLNKKEITYQLINYLFWFFVSCALILCEFARYFVINNIEISYLEISQNLYKIEDTSVILAFFGMLILIGCLFNFYPFNSKNLSNSIKINSLVYSLMNVNFLLLGSCLLLKFYSIFDYLFFQFQDRLAIYLLINFIIYIILIFRQKSLIRFLTTIFCSCFIIGIFPLFAFEDECTNIFLYYSMITCASYCLSAFVFMILANKFKTDSIDEFKKIEDKTKISQFFIFISMLNIAFVPLLPMFSVQMISLMLMFSTDFKGDILNIISYILLFGIFAISLAGLNVLYKILIEPVEKCEAKVMMSKHQVLVCSLLLFVLIIWKFFLNVLINQ